MKRYILIVTTIIFSMFYDANAEGPAATDGRNNRTVFIADFNGDKLADTLTILRNIKIPDLPKEWEIYNPFSQEKPAAEEPIALKFYITGTQRIELLYDSAYFSTPGWISGEFWAVVVKKGTKKYNLWKKSVKALTSDAIELYTEAGINILLYRCKNKFVVFWPDEEP